MDYPPFEHDHAIDSHIIEEDGRKVLIIYTLLTLDEGGDGFDAIAINDLSTAAAIYAESYPGLYELRLIRVRH